MPNIKIKIKTEKLERLLGKNNISRRMLAKACNISKSYLSKIILDGRTPSPLVRKKLLEVLEIPFEELFIIEQEPLEEEWKIPPEKVKFGLITCMEVPYFVAWAKSWRELSIKYDFTLIEAKGGLLAEDYLRGTEELLKQDINILLEPGNTSSIASGINAEQAIKVGAFMITHTVLPYTKEVRWGAIIVNSIVDAKNLGIVAGMYFQKEYPEKDPVMLVLELTTSEEVVSRITGFQAGFKEIYPGVTIIKKDTSGKENIWTRKGGYIASKEILAIHPEINMVFSPGENYCLGALLAFEEVGRGTTDNELFVSYDISPDMAKKLRDPNSALKISLAQYPFDDAKKGLLMAMRIVNKLVNWEVSPPREMCKTRIFTFKDLNDIDNYLKEQKFSGSIFSKKLISSW